MKTAGNSSIEEFRYREQKAFIRSISVDLEPIERSFTHQSLSINSSSLTLQVEMTSALFDHLADCFRNKFPIHVQHEDIGRKKVILRHTRRYRAVFTKWIFSFTRSVSTRELKKLSAVR